MEVFPVGEFPYQDRARIGSSVYQTAPVSDPHPIFLPTNGEPQRPLFLRDPFVTRLLFRGVFEHQLHLRQNFGLVVLDLEQVVPVNYEL